MHCERDVDQILQQIAQLANYTAHRADQTLQLDLARFWADEIAKPRNAHPKRLLRHGFKVYSQGDEDEIIQEIFNRIGTTNRTFIEFGVETGVECNTVKLLLEGWRGLWLDGSATHVANIRTNFAAFVNAGRLQTAEAFISAENINALFEQGGVTGDIDLLSIDIDRNDYWVWKAIEVVKPRVIVTEYNATLRPPLSLVVPYDPRAVWNGTNYFGASLEALTRLGREKGYRLVGCSFSGANAFFVRNDAAGDHFFDPGHVAGALRTAALFLRHGDGGTPAAARTVRHGLSKGAASLPTLARSSFRIGDLFALW